MSNLESLLRSDLAAIESTASDLFKTYPPDKYLYVAIGSSPAPLQALITIRFPWVEFINVPMTGLNRGFQNSILQTDEDKIILQRLRDFLPPQNKLSKGLVLIDYVNTGRTLLRVLQAARFLYRSSDVGTYGLFDSKAQKEMWEKEGRKGFYIGDNSFAMHLDRSDYGAWAEFESIDFRYEKVLKNYWHTTLLEVMTRLSAGSNSSRLCSQIFSKQ